MWMSLASSAGAALTPSECHDLVRSHADIATAAKSLQHEASSGAFPVPTPRLANASVIASQLELHFRMRQNTESDPNFLGDCDLAFTGNLHW
jgi:hypothetical protein